MEVTVPLFVISIALFLLALVAAANDRRAWARRFAATAVAQPQPEAPLRREVELGSLTLAGRARSLVHEAPDELPPSIGELPPSIGEQRAAALDPPEPPRTAIAAPASSRSHAGTTPQSQVSQLLRRPLPRPFPPQDRLRLAELTTKTLPVPARGRARAVGSIPPTPRPSTDPTTDEMPTIVSARALASRPAVPASAPAFSSRRAAPEGAAPRAKGTPPPRPLGEQRALPSWPVIHPTAPSRSRRRRPG